MHHGTKLGLALIALAFLTASTAVSAHFVAKALERAHDKFTGPRVLRGCGPADAVNMPETASAGASRLVGDAKT
jgi:hypothetical protein